jgi:DNA-directed RNA polymerase specialized sigma24 family protein
VNEAIITKLYAEKKYRNLTKSICTKYGREYADDLHTEIVIRIIEKGDDLANINDLFHYFFAFAHRTINEYKISKKYGYNFNRIDGGKFNEFTATATVTFKYELLPSDKLYVLLEPHEKDTFRDDYKKKLFKIYLEEGNYRAVAKSTKIPLRNVAETLQEFKNELLKKIK